MEIRVERRLTGRAYRQEVLHRYGSRERLEEKAAAGDPLAQDHLTDLELLEASPDRLDDEYEIETVRELGPEDLTRLTPARLRLLAAVAGQDVGGGRTEGAEEATGSQGTQGGSTPSSGAPDSGSNVTDLARQVGRDKKNVSEDLHLLEELGLLVLEERGRETIPRTRRGEVHIVVETQPTGPDGAGSGGAPG